MTNIKSPTLSLATCALLLLLSVPAAFAIEAADVKAGNAEAGAAVFDNHCAFCHGAKGFGDGPAAELFDPRPRDFRPGLYKIRSTQTGELPTDADILHTVTNGMPGTGMPSFRHLTDKEIADVIAFVKTLGGPEGEEGNWFALYEVPEGEVVPPAPELTAEEVQKKGAELYVKIGCDGCHGKTGKGDGKKPEEMLDNWGHPVHPRSFNVGLFKGGSRSEDLYMRVLTGLDGSPMTGFWKEAMTPDERWTVVRYVLSFGKTLHVKQASPTEVAVTDAKLADSIDAPVWQSAKETELSRLVPKGGWMRHYEPLSLKAVRDGEQLGLLISWDDGQNTCPQVEVLLPEGERMRTFDLGTKGEPATVWRWNPKDGAKAILSRGPEWEKPIEDVKLVARSKTEGTRTTLLLEGPIRAAVIKQMLITVAGCADRGNFLTATTYNRLP